MEINLRFEFNSGSEKGFIMKNPPVLPATGEIVDIDWAHFVEDKIQVARLQEDAEDHCFIAEVLSKKYTKDEVEILVILHRDDSPEVERLQQRTSVGN